MAGDLKLTVDIAALLQAQSIVKKMDGQTINLKFRTTGLNDINSIKKSLSGISGASKTSAQDVNRIAASFDNLGSAIKKSNTTNSDGSTKSIEKYNKTIGETITLTEKVSAAKKKSSSVTVSKVDAEKQELANLGKQKDLLAKIETIQTQKLSKYSNQSALSGLAEDLKKVDTASVGFQKSYARINQSVKGYETEAKSAAYAQNQLTQANKKNLLSFDNIKESMGTAAVRTVEWAVSMGALYGAFNAVRSMVTTSSAIADQMTSIKMVTGASNSEIAVMLGTYQNIATELSSTTSAVAASAEVWLRQGRTIADTNSLIETTTVLSKVGFMDSATSAQMLTSAINGYGIAAEDAMGVVDKMSAIDVAAATSTEDLALAMAQTASGAKIAGVSMDELLSYIATIADVTQASGDTIGVSLKTIFARINSVKLGSLTDGEGQDISRVETALKQYGITLRSTNGTAKDTGDILDELSTKWGTLTGLEKSEIAMQMAGVHQKEKFLVLMENYNKALKYQDIAANSAGSAMQKMSIWEETTEAATQRLTNQWEILSTTMVDSGFTKFLINVGAGAISALSSDMGQLAIKLIGVATAAALFSVAGKKIASFFTSSGIPDGVGGIVKSFGKLKEARNVFAGIKYAESIGDLFTADEMAAEAVEKFGKKSLAAKVATDGLGQTLITVATSAVGGFGIAMIGAAAALGVADYATVSFGEHIENLRGLRTNFDDTTTQITGLTTSLESNQARIKEIKSLGTLSITDNAEITKLENVNSQLQTQIEALNQINDITKAQMSREAIGAMTSISKQSIQDKSGLVNMGVISGQKITEVDYMKEQMSAVADMENKLSDLEDNRRKYSATEYKTKYDDLIEEQQKYSKAANESAMTLNDLASNIDGTTEEGQKQLGIIAQLNGMLKENNKLVSDSSELQSKTSAEKASSYDGGVAGEYSDYTGYISKIQAGLESGLTETTVFDEAMKALFGESIPGDLSASLEKIGTLFSEDTNSVEDMSTALAGYKNAAGTGFDMSKIQQEFGLSKDALATLSERLYNLGMLLPSAMGVDAISTIRSFGNGLGLASEDASNLEGKVKQLYDQVKAGGDFSKATEELNAYLGEDGLGLSDDKISTVLDNWDFMMNGVSDRTYAAFTGLGGADATEIEGIAKGFSDTFAKSIEGATSLDEIDLDLAFNVSKIQDSLRTALADSGLSESEINGVVEEVAGRAIEVNMDAIAKINFKDVPAENIDQLHEIIQNNIDSSTGEFKVDNIQLELTKAGISGDWVAPLMADLEEVNTKAQAIKINVDANDGVGAMAGIGSAADGAKQKAEALDAISLAGATGQASGLASQIQSSEGATQSVLNKLSELDGKVVNSEVIVTYKAVGDSQAMADSGGGNVAAASNMGSYVNMNTGMEVKSATGRINIDTSSIGTQSLIGEEGEETLIRNGNVSFIGTSGAEIIPIRDGDTILPADITKRIKSGQIPMYASGKYNVSVTGSKSAQSVSNYRDSGNYNGLGTEPPEDEAAKKAYEEHKKAFDKESAYIQHLRDMDEIDEAEYYKRLDSLNESYFANKNEYLDEYRDHEKEVYEFLKKQEEERLAKLEENYDSSSSYVLDFLDKEIDALKEKEDLAEKQDKVDNLKANKNQRVYYEGKGWVWEADKTTIAEAEKDVTDDSESAKLQEYRDKWESIQKNYENEQNKIEAIALLGDDFETKLKNGDLDILRDFATKYSKVLGDVSSNEGDTSVPLLDYAKAWQTDEVKRLMGSESTSGILTAALNNNLSGLTTSAISSNQASSNETNINISNVNLDNVTDFDSFISEAKQYAKVNSPKQ